MVKSLDFDQGLKVSVPRNLATTWPALQTQSNLSNFCKAAMISILQPDWKIDNGFLTGQSWQVLKSWYTGGDPEQEFQHCFADKPELWVHLWCRLATPWTRKKGVKQIL